MVTFDANDEEDDIQDQDGDADEDISGDLDELVDHDHGVVMDDQMDGEMGNGGFSIESGLITYLGGEPVDANGEPFTEDFTEIFDNLGRESGDDPDYDIVDDTDTEPDADR